MKKLGNYTIDIFGLSDSTHKFNFIFNSTFFSYFENSLINDGKGTCGVILTKTDLMISLNLNIEGVIQLECDRSLELFDYPIKMTKELIFKYGNEEKELSDDLFVISSKTQEITLGTILYELISLEIPMKKLHPNFLDQNNNELDYISEETDDLQNNNNIIDPRWDVLKKLKLNKN